jgi:hypothetical protein
MNLRSSRFKSYRRGDAMIGAASLAPLAIIARMLESRRNRYIGGHRVHTERSAPISSR